MTEAPDELPKKSDNWKYSRLAIGLFLSVISL
jgi:hypothetical protein